VAFGLSAPNMSEMLTRRSAIGDRATTVGQARLDDGVGVPADAAGQSPIDGRTMHSISTIFPSVYGC
jgi:hypothetical protein